MTYMGWLMIIMPFIAAFIYIWKTETLKIASIMFASVGALLLWFYWAIDIVNGG